MSDLICGKAAVGGNYNSTRDKQGIDLIPQVHEGPHVRNMEAKGIATEKGNLNRWIKEINKGILTLSKQVKDILSNIAELMRLIAEKEAEARQPDLADYINSYFAKRNETGGYLDRPYSGMVGSYIL